MTDINEVIIKCLDGSATESEKAMLTDWLSRSDQNRADFMEIRDLWLTTSACQEENDLSTDEAFKSLLHHIMERDFRHKNLFSSTRSRIIAVAASIALIFGVGYASYEVGSHSVAPQTVLVNKLITASGCKGRFLLPDSTVVWLNANTTLVYPETFADTSRTVSLTGEAYFEVKRDVSRPFIVDADGLKVRVLGTHFVVENYPQRPTAEAVLVEGSVEVSSPDNPYPKVLSPGQRLVFSKNGDDVEVSQVNPANYTSWIHDMIEFDNRSLADVLANLENWFIVDIHCDPAVNIDIPMSFSVRNGESLEDIMTSISIVAPISYYWKDNELYIQPVKH